MLTFVGLGLYDETSVTVEGRRAIEAADQVFAEFYTSRLVGTDLETLETFHDTSIEVRDRTGVEGDPGAILDAAEAGTVAFLTAGDAMISTTHVDLRLRAAGRGIDTRIVHGTTAETAAASVTGLQNYRFGPAATLPFPRSGAPTIPGNVLDTLEENDERGLHTVLYLDIDAPAERYMTASEGAGILAERMPDHLGVAVARAGGPDPVVASDRLTVLADGAFGGPLHLLVLPGSLHHMEAEALATFAGAPRAVLEERLV